MGKWRSQDREGASTSARSLGTSRLRRLGRRVVGRLRGVRSEPVPDEATVTFLPARGGEPLAFRADTGTTLLAVARANGLDIASYCGGKCSCGTCRVGVALGTEALTLRTPNEAMVLGDSQVRAGERLACQARLLGDVTVQLMDLY